MKLRQGFVSNSSSSSFLLNRYYLSEHQVEQIKNHIKVALEAVKQNKEARKLFIYPNDGDAWNVEVTEDKVELRTDMDNFEMDDFLTFIGVPKDAYIKKERDGDW